MAIHWEPIGEGRMLAVNTDYTFGTDAVLLAHFATPLSANEAVCDLGTGCGCIPFLLMNNHTLPQFVLGVDIQPDAIVLCRLSAEKNKLGTLHFLEADWRQPKTIAPAGSFDRVICNPPYFAPGSGKISAAAPHRIARHETGETLPSLCSAARYLLRFGGRLSLCHRPERLADVICALRENGLEPKRLQPVQQRTDAAPWLILLEAVKGAKPGLQIFPSYVLEDENGKTAFYHEIYGKYSNI